MELTVKSVDAAAAQSALQVSETVFAARFNEPLVHQVVTAWQAGARAGTKGQKSRSTASGGGAKPWRQKGMGRARAGTRRSPIWVGGGRAFAAQPRGYGQKVNRKMYRGAMRAIFSELVRQQRMQIIEAFLLESPKTQTLNNLLRTMALQDVLIISDEIDRNLYLAARNLPRVDVVDVAAIDPVALLSYRVVLTTKSAIQQIEAWLA